MPQLLDACARGGAIEEALDLRAFVARAALLHPDLQARQQPALQGRCLLESHHSGSDDTLYVITCELCGDECSREMR